MDSRDTYERQKMPMAAWFAIIAGVLIIGFFAGIIYLKNTNSQHANQTAGAMTTAGGGQQMMGGGMGPGGPGGGGGGGTCANGQPRAMLMLAGERIQTCGMPRIGTVTAIGDASITVETSEGTETFAVTSETKIVEQGGTGTLSGISVGDQRAIIPNENDAARADYILPPQGGAQM